MPFLWLFNLVRATLGKFIVWCTVCKTDWLLFFQQILPREILINRLCASALTHFRQQFIVWRRKHHGSSRAFVIVVQAISFYLPRRSISLWWDGGIFAFLQFYVRVRFSSERVQTELETKSACERNGYLNGENRRSSQLNT